MTSSALRTRGTSSVAVHRLTQEISGPEFQSLTFRLFVVGSRDHDDRQIRPFPLNSTASSTRRATRVDENCGTLTPRPRHHQLRLPTRSLADLPRVRRYLTQERGLAATILDFLIDDGKLYADERGNAVFVMVAGKPS